MEKIDNILLRRIKSKGFNSLAKASQICYIAKDISNGEFSPVSFKEGILTVQVKSSIEAQEIQLKSSQIIKKINQKIGDDLVHRIKFRVR